MFCLFFWKNCFQKNQTSQVHIFQLLSFPPFIVVIHMIFLLFGCRYIVTLLQVGKKGKGWMKEWHNTKYANDSTQIHRMTQLGNYQLITLCVQLTGVSVETMHLELRQTPENRVRNRDGKVHVYRPWYLCVSAICKEKQRSNSTSENVSGVIKLQARLVNKYFKYREIFYTEL